MKANAYDALDAVYSGRNLAVTVALEGHESCTFRMDDCGTVISKSKTFGVCKREDITPSRLLRHFRRMLRQGGTLNIIPSSFVNGIEFTRTIEDIDLIRTHSKEERDSAIQYWMMNHYYDDIDEDRGTYEGYPAIFMMNNHSTELIVTIE